MIYSYFLTALEKIVQSFIDIFHFYIYETELLECLSITRV